MSEKLELIADVGCAKATELYRMVENGHDNGLALALIERHRLEKEHKEDCFVHDPQK